MGKSLVNKYVGVCSQTKCKCSLNCNSDHWAALKYLCLISITASLMLQAHFVESLTYAVNVCLPHSRLFSSSSLGTNEVVVQPSPSTSYLASDDGVSNSASMHRSQSFEGG